MNYLFHLYLSGEDPDVMTGNFMGDFVKGRLGDEYPPRLRTGLVLHRHIDSFAQGHPLFTRSRLRISPEFGLYRGILVDLYYDHFLAVTWSSWSSEPLHRYLQRARGNVESNYRHLPARLQALLPVIFEEMIPSYLTTAGVEKALQRMSRRVVRENPLAGGGVELTRHYQALQADFQQFLPSVRDYASAQLHDSPASLP